MEYVTKNGDTVEARGLTLKVELGEKTKSEIVSKVMAMMQDAMETIERLTQALADADAENARLRESVRNLLTCVKHEECEESCPHYSPTYSTYGHDSYGSIVVEDEYLGCCLVGLENCNSMLFNTDEYLRELGTEEDA